MPQTRFVLTKAFDYHLRPIVVINKIDRTVQTRCRLWCEGTAVCLRTPHTQEFAMAHANVYTPSRETG